MMPPFSVVRSSVVPGSPLSGSSLAKPVYPVRSRGLTVVPLSSRHSKRYRNVASFQKGKFFLAGRKLDISSIKSRMPTQNYDYVYVPFREVSSITVPTTPPVRSERISNKDLTPYPRLVLVPILLQTS
jgi:hypothetical protein